MQVQLNIGLSIGQHGNNVGNIGVGTVLRDTHAVFACETPMAHRVAISACGERTVCITLDTNVKPATVEARIHFLCTLLQQDCIAGRWLQAPDTEGFEFLYGPDTEPYGNTFNAAEWASCPL